MSVVVVVCLSLLLFVLIVVLCLLWLLLLMRVVCCLGRFVFVDVVVLWIC